MKKIKSLVVGQKIGLVTLFSLGLRLFRLTTPSGLVFDEKIYVQGFDLFRNNHPPLGYELFKLGRQFLGPDPWSWRLAPVLAGTFLIPLLYLLARELFEDESIALMAAIFLSFESLTFVHSRLATIDILVTFFVLGSAYFFLKSRRKAKKGGKSSSLVVNYSLLTAFFLGLALATKWSAVFIWAVIFLSSIRVNRSQAALFCFLPLLIYGGVFLAAGFSGDQILSWHQRVFGFHRRPGEGLNLEMTSPFWAWPLLFSPRTYFRRQSFSPQGNFTQVVNAAGNMPLFWAFLPSFVFLLGELFRSWKQKKRFLARPSLFLAVCFFANWLPWAFSPRPTFGYYFLPAIPFGCLGVAVFLKQGWRKLQLRPWIKGYLALVIGFFILLYPIFAAVPISERVLNFVSRLG